MKVNWDDYSQYVEEKKVPNHQPDYINIYIYIYDYIRNYTTITTVYVCKGQIIQ